MNTKEQYIGKMVKVRVNRDHELWIGPVSCVGKTYEGEFVDTPTGQYWHDILDSKDVIDDEA